MQWKGTFFAALCASAMAIGTASAAPISGILNTTGSVGISTNVIDFLPAGGGVGNFTVDPFTQTGTFVPLAGTTGTIKDLTSAMAPVNTPINIPNFMTFAANPNLSFSLTFLPSGVFSPALCLAPPAAGENCTPPNSPFNLTDTSTTSSVASFTVKGIVKDSSTGMSAPYVGTFSTQFTNLSYQDVLAIVNGGGTVDASYSANFVVGNVPEPATTTLMLVGGVLLAAGRFGRKLRTPRA